MVDTGHGASGLRTAVDIAEQICGLPAVATQDWCDKAAAALLKIGHPSNALVVIGSVGPDGKVRRVEATGIAGSYVAEVTTTVGRAQAATSVLPMDSREPGLARLRALISQARELGWAPGQLAEGKWRVGLAERIATMQPWTRGPLGKRWESLATGGVLLGAFSIGGADGDRMIIVEIARSGVSEGMGVTEEELLSAVLPALGRRAILAIGGADASDSGQWLTPREQIILQHLLLGKSVRQIAEELGRSPHTVHDHVKSLHRKLNASSRGELVAKALGHTEPKEGDLAMHREPARAHS